MGHQGVKDLVTKLNDLKAGAPAAPAAKASPKSSPKSSPKAAPKPEPKKEAKKDAKKDAPMQVARRRRNQLLRSLRR